MSQKRKKRVIPRFYFSRDFETHKETILNAGAAKLAFNKGKILHNASEAEHTMYYIEEGMVKLIFIDERGNENLLYLLGPGSIWPINLMEEEFTLEPYLYLVAVTDIRTLAFSHSQLKKMLKADPEFMYDIINHYSAQGNMYISRLFISTSQEMTTKLATFLLSFLEYRSNEFNDIMLSQSDLMGIMGVSRSTLARALKKLRNQGAIETYKNRIKIIDADILWSISSELIRTTTEV